MNYNVQYFIEKFEQIPPEKWTTRVYRDPGSGSRCALGHCGPFSDEAYALRRLLEPRFGGVGLINDGFHSQFQQATPKARILAALRSLPPHEGDGDTD